MRSNGSALAVHTIDSNSGELPVADMARKNNFGDFIASMGDVNQDGVPDLLVGNAGRSSGTNRDKGLAFAILLNANGTVKGSLVIDTTQGSLGISRGLAYFGYGVGTIMTGNEMVAAGASGGCKVAIRDDGESFMIVNLESNLTLGESTQISCSQLGAGTRCQGFFGSAITGIGDLDNDTVFDVAVMAPGAQGGYGAIFVVMLNADDTVKGYQELSSSRGGLGDFTPFRQYRMGNVRQLSAADLNGDGLRDLVFGDWVSSRALVLFLGSNGVAFGGQDAKFSERMAPTEVTSTGDTGYVVAPVGDANGDDYVDLVVTSGQFRSGMSLIYVNRQPPSPSPSPSMSSTPSITPAKLLHPLLRRVSLHLLASLLVAPAQRRRHRVVEVTEEPRRSPLPLPLHRCSR